MNCPLCQELTKRADAIVAKEREAQTMIAQAHDEK
jgi:hypothetical protein